MGIEIERKFLVSGNDWRQFVIPEDYIQGYLSDDEGLIVRVRIAGNRGYLTIKDKTYDFTRKEYEYSVPVEDAKDLLALCKGSVIKKKRSKITWQEKTWEIDEFSGKNEGLIIAEIELESEDESFDIPPWIGKEVTGDPRFYNSYLSRHPYTEW